jgi:DNA modification methylase
MFSDDELPFLQVSDEGDPEPGEGGDEFDDTPDEEQTRVQAGDVWRCGDHLVACGDSTEPALWGQLLGKERASICWTDPPWNVDYGGSAHPSWKKRTIANDNLGKDFVVFATQFAVQIAEWCLPGAPLYMAMSAQEWPVIDKVLRDAGFHWSSTVIWVKDSLVLSRKDYHTQYEPIWYGWKEGAARLVELEDRTQSDTWFIPRPKRSDEHPTMKPIALVERSLRNSSAPGAIVIDPFGGSGTTLIAAERCRRRAVVAELSPAYCDVIVRRWETETKRQAEKLNERPRETQKAEEGKASARKTNKAHS